MWTGVPAGDFYAHVTGESQRYVTVFTPTTTKDACPSSSLCLRTTSRYPEGVRRQ